EVPHQAPAGGAIDGDAAFTGLQPYLLHDLWSQDDPLVTPAQSVGLDLQQGAENPDEGVRRPLGELERNEPHMLLLRVVLREILDSAPHEKGNWCLHVLLLEAEVKGCPGVAVRKLIGRVLAEIGYQAGSLHGAGVQDTGQVLGSDGKPDIGGDQPTLEYHLSVERHLSIAELLVEPSEALGSQVLHSVSLP